MHLVIVNGRRQRQPVDKAVQRAIISHVKHRSVFFLAKRMSKQLIN